MTDHPPRLDVVRRFRADLMTARPRPARRYVPVFVAAAAAMATFVVAVFVGFGGGGTEQALAITRDLNSIVVHLADANAGPQRLTDELHKAGINATVLVAPVAPDKAGTWVKVASPRLAGPSTDTSVHDAFDEKAEAAQARQRVRGVVVDATEVRIPADFSAPLVLIVGRAAKPGETPISP
jgi:hypothetical protein